jgi:hypothetical protein
MAVSKCFNHSATFIIWARRSADILQDPPRFFLVIKADVDGVGIKLKNNEIRCDAFSPLKVWDSRQVECGAFRGKTLSADHDSALAAISVLHILSSISTIVIHWGNDIEHQHPLAACHLLGETKV